MDRQAHSGVVAAHEGLPDGLVVSLPREEVFARLEALARRGKLPEFSPGKERVLFSVHAYGAPFDHRLEGVARQVGPSLRISLRLRMLPKLPAIFGILTLLSIWPGVWLTDSMLRTYFNTYDYQTWMWYLPLSIVPLPWALRAMFRRSRAAAFASARESLAIIIPALGASVYSASPKTASVVGSLDPST